MRKVWYHQTSIKNNLGFMVLILMYIFILNSNILKLREHVESFYMMARESRDKYREP